MNMRFNYVSPSVMRLLGYTPEQMIILTMEKFLTSDSSQAILKAFEEETVKFE